MSEKLRNVRKKVSHVIRSRAALFITVGVFTIIGAITLLATRAATPSLGVEAEKGIASGSASIMSDASASGGSAVKFGALTTPPPPPPSTTGWNVPVTDGVVTYTVTTGDNTAALQAAINTAVAANKKFVISGGIANVSGRIRIPNAPAGKRPHVVFTAGSGIRQNSIHQSFGGTEPQGAFGQWGSMGDATYTITGGTEQFSDLVTFSSVAGLSVGNWIWLQSDDQYSHKPTNPGFLRKITAISGNQVKIDKGLHRAMSTNRKAFVMNLAPGAYIEGGIIEHANKLKSLYNLVRFDMVADPQVNGMVIRQGGASGLKNTVVLNGRFDITVHDLVDDESTSRYNSGRHYGYGIDDEASRGTIYRILESYNVRHAYTSGAIEWMSGVENRLLTYGEPEDVRVIHLNTHDTTSTGHNTHEPGWNISAEGKITSPGRWRATGSTNGKEGGGGMFFRARKDTIRPRSLADNLGPGGMIVTDAYDSAIEVSEASKKCDSQGQNCVYVLGPTWSIGDAPTYQDVTVTNHHGSKLFAAYQIVKLGPNIRLVGPAPVGISTAGTRSHAAGSLFIGSVNIEGAVATPIDNPTDFTGASQFVKIIR